MKPKILTDIKKALATHFSPSEIDHLTTLILDRVLGLSLTEVYASDAIEISDEQQRAIYNIVERLKKREPIQYIFGTTDFCNLRFWTSPSALIPRPETEELVEWVMEKNTLEEPKILDIGTGSGCIAVSLGQKIKKATNFAFDVSLDALNLAYENATANDVIVRFYHINILKQPDWDVKFDIIVSNPPYVLESEKSTMDANVLNYEPAMALFVPDDDPLIFYRHIAQFAQKQLVEGGQLFFEINQKMGKEVVALLKNSGFNEVELRKDLSGNDRFVRAKK